MKKITAFVSIILLIFPATGMAPSDKATLFGKTETVTHGEIIAVSCSESYPTLGQPVHLFVTLEGNAEERYNETITITDEFSGLVMTAGTLQWISSTVIEYHMNVTIGKLPKYTSKISWYPSVVGNHTFRVTAGSFSEKQLNVSVGFDVEGIITPSLGCPSIVSKDNTTQFSVTLSEERLLTDEPAQVSNVMLQSIDGTSIYDLENQTGAWSTWITIGPDVVEDELIVSYDIQSIPEGFYNLTVTTTTGNYSWPHAVQIIATEPTEYTIVQLSDTPYWEILKLCQ